MSARRITLRIGTVVIDGGGHSSRALRTAIERELRSQLSQPLVLDTIVSGRTVERLGAETAIERVGDTLGESVAGAALEAIRR